MRPGERAAVLAIGTANPMNCVRQDDYEYADWYFRATGSDHLPHLKAKIKRMCTCALRVLFFLCFEIE
jgi:hypothetical protein